MVGRALKRTLQAKGYRATWCVEPLPALRVLVEKPFNALLVNPTVARPHSIELVRAFKYESRGAPLIVLSDAADIEFAVHCMKEGAFHVISKSPDISRILSIVQESTRDPQPAQPLPNQPFELKTDELKLFWKHLRRAQTLWGLDDSESRVLSGILFDKTTETMAVEIGRSRRWVDQKVNKLLTKTSSIGRANLITKFWVGLRD